MYLSWIIPAHNEARRIESTIREVRAYLELKNLSEGYEIVVVDSASTDDTKGVVESLAIEMPRIRMVRVARRGKGAAVREGMRAARGEIRLFSDADNSTAPCHFDYMRPLFDAGYEVVISSRHHRDAPGARRVVKESRIREVLGSLGNHIIQLVVMPGIWDTQNGFKAVSARAAEDIFSRARMNGFSFDIEMLALARYLGYRMGVIPAEWRFHTNSTVRASTYAAVLRDVARIKWNLMTNTYG